MKKILLSATILGLSLSGLYATEDAENLFDAKCSMCHLKTMPSDKSKLLAPAIMGVMRHIKMSYPKKDDAVKFMVDYVLNPTKEKSICMPQKIKKFGMMPSQKGSVTPKEVKEISEWMFDNFPPENFKGQGMMNKQGNINGMNMRNRPTFESFDSDGNGVISKKEFNDFLDNRIKNKNNQ